MEIRVLLFVQEGSAKQKYFDALAACGVQVFVTSSFSELSEEICSHTYHGLFLDLPTKLKAIRKNKTYVYNLVEKFPVSHLQTDNKTGEVRCFHFYKNSSKTLLDFINSQCRNFLPRRIREEIRKEIYLHLTVYKHKDDKKPERSVTKDISSGGCFIFSTRRWREGDDIWIRFKEMIDSPLIRAQIRTVVKWGDCHQVPGIGVGFVELLQPHAEELSRIVKNNFQGN